VTAGTSTTLAARIASGSQAPLGLAQYTCQNGIAPVEFNREGKLAPALPAVSLAGTHRTSDSGVAES